MIWSQVQFIEFIQSCKSIHHSIVKKLRFNLLCMHLCKTKCMISVADAGSVLSCLVWGQCQYKYKDAQINTHTERPLWSMHKKLQRFHLCDAYWQRSQAPDYNHTNALSVSQTQQRHLFHSHAQQETTNYIEQCIMCLRHACQCLASSVRCPPVTRVRPSSWDH